MPWRSLNVADLKSGATSYDSARLGASGRPAPRPPLCPAPPQAESRPSAAPLAASRARKARRPSRLIAFAIARTPPCVSQTALVALGQILEEPCFVAFPSIHRRSGHRLYRFFERAHQLSVAGAAATMGKRVRFGPYFFLQAPPGRSGAEVLPE